MSCWKCYFLIFMFWANAQAAPAGPLIIDPTVTIDYASDTRLQNATNFGGDGTLMVGKKSDSVKKRTIIKFDFQYSGIPGNATILNSELQLYYYDAQRAGGDAWQDRWVQAHQVLNNWDELQADSLKRLTGVNWLAPRGKIGPGSNPASEDANGQFESTMLFQTGQTGTWKVWNLTALTQKWINGTVANYGVILWATNEDVNAYDLRFYSRENATNKPKLVVTWSNTPKTVYFLKDHLGSIRATVLDSAGAPVIGYDDYDPWGYPLALRTKAIPNAYLQGASKNKFTGQMWDDDYLLNWYHFDGGRKYMPDIARWATPDPLWQKHPEVSPYAYVLNNPMILVDPDGQQVVYHRVVQKPPTTAEIRENFAEKVALSNAYASGGLHQMAIGTLVLGVLEAAGSVYQKIDPLGIAGLYNPLAIGSLVVQEGRTISQAERAIGELLSKEGKAVEFLAESNMGRTADALVGGVATEFKTVSNLTSKDISGALARRILEGRGQAGNIIIDARGQKGLTKELAENAIKRAFVKDSDKKLLKEIRIVGEDFDITIPRIE